MLNIPLKENVFVSAKVISHNEPSLDWFHFKMKIDERKRKCFEVLDEIVECPSPSESTLLCMSVRDPNFEHYDIK